MKKNPKVSILTSWYNGEMFVDNYMKSILHQDYDNLELVIVNDGSSDCSEEKILKYESELDSKGICFKYISKNNGGPSSALNSTLKVFTGAYFTCIDMDDVIYPDYISKKVTYMENHRDVDYLVSKGAIRNLDNPDEVIRYTWSKKPTSNEDMWNRIINNKDFNYESENFFIRTSFYLKVNPQLSIYDKCGKMSGPNIQVMLPVIFWGNMGFIEDVLFDYYLHNNNLHNNYVMDEVKKKSIENEKKVIRQKYKVNYDVYVASIKSLHLSERKEKQYLECIKKRLYNEELYSAFVYRDLNWFCKIYLKEKKYATFRTRARYLIIKNKILNSICWQVK